MAADDAPPTLAAASAFPDVMGDPAVRRRRSEISARLFGSEEQPQRVGRYRLGRRLGSGAIGVVHLAHDHLLDRDVALKLLRTHGDADIRRALREAQALARLAHPNVVSVFATGIDGGHAFIAMELVVGSTLRAWQKDRPWREILGAYVQAGRGLAAAHEAGIVHRDFKPDNAMIGPDGRVRVLDFGLARGLAVPAEAKQPAAIAELASDELVRSATGAGALVGTPAYMAPEQLSGVDADARSDQFAFCVALFEAFWGERPFAGTTPAGLLERQLAEEVRARPARSHVPPRIHDVLRRGLRADPDARWPTMAACLDALHRAARPWSPRLVWGMGIVIATAIAATASLRSEQPRDCSGARERLSGIWDDARRAQLEAAFGPDTPRSNVAWAGARGRLDAYAEQWAEVWSQTCREAEGPGLVVRMRCLSRRRDILAATIDGLISAKPMNARAPALLGGLEPIDACLDANERDAVGELPEDPARAAAVEAVEREMIVAHTQMVAGHLDRGLRQYEAALSQARELDWPPLLAHALYWNAAAADQLERWEEARELYEEGYALAVANRRDDLAALAATHMTSLLGYEQSKPDEAARWARLAQAAIDRLGRPNSIEADLFNNLGLVAMNQGDHATAREHYLHSIAIYEELGTRTPLATPLQNLAEVAYLAGDYEEAEGLLGRAIEIKGGPGQDEHPNLIPLLINRGIVRIDRAQFEDAEADLQQAHALCERSLGPDSQSCGAALSQLGSLAAAQRDWSTALEYFRRAVDTYARGIGRDNERAAFAQAGAGTALVQLGRVDEGDALIMQSIIELESLFGSDHEEVGDAASDLGSARLVAGRPAEALAPLRRATEILVRVDGANSLRVMRARADLGRALLELGRIDEALEELEWALGVLQAYTLPPHEPATVRFALARALAARAGRVSAETRAHDAERIATLSSAAADGYRAAGPAYRDELALVEAFAR